MEIAWRQSDPRGGGRGAIRRAGLALLVVNSFPWFSLLAADPPRPTKNPTDLAGYDATIKAEDRAHWAFQPINPRSVPKVKNTAWPRNAIDRFVLAKLEDKGLPPAQAAEPQALIRRIFLDLTGLPPTPE